MDNIIITGFIIALFGLNYSGTGGFIFSVSNAAKSSVVHVLMVEGNTNTPVINWRF